MTSQTNPPNPPAQTTPNAEKGIPGAYVVVGMFAFGLMATGTLFVYWHFHNAPFKELQAALATEFEGSRPRVEGGQRKIHKHTPRILRVVLKVEFSPQLEKAKSEQVADRVMELAAKHHPLEDYDTVEIHLYWPEKEKTIHEHVIEREVHKAK